MRRQLRNKRGQTSLEYLLLLAATFITAYIMVRGPIGKFTNQMFANIFSGLQNLITYAEWSSEDMEDVTKGSNPASPDRLKPLHL